MVYYYRCIHIPDIMAHEQGSYSLEHRFIVYKIANYDS